MKKTIATPYDVAEHLDACIEEVNGDAAFITKALGGYCKGQRDDSGG